MIVCLDADCTIYFVEQNPVWGPKITARLAVLRAAGHELAVSDLSRTECLAKPLATGDVAVKVPDCLHLAAAIEHGCGLFLTHDAQLRLCKDITVEILT
jgi:predicted nucleic acid-binding protein